MLVKIHTRPHPLVQIWMDKQIEGKLRRGGDRKLPSLYNDFVPETKAFRLTESVRAAG
jgi:hypothetical protein